MERICVSKESSKDDCKFYEIFVLSYHVERKDFNNIYIFEIILRNNFSHQDLKDEKFSLLSSIKGKENQGSLLSDNLKERKYYSERVIETVTLLWKRGPKGPFNSILNF